MNAKVGIIMGSDSDLPVMRAAAAVLDELGAIVADDMPNDGQLMQPPTRKAR